MMDSGRDGPADTWTVRVEADTSALQNDLKTAANLGRQFGASLTAAFEGVALKGRGGSGVLQELARNLSHFALKAALKPIEQGFGSLFAGLLAGASGFAKGAPFPQGLPMPFAQGGVIQSPVAFPLAGGRAGLAGERGAEAILPLARGPDGRLGVAAQGEGRAVTITFNVWAADAESFRRSEGQIAAMLARAVGRGRRNL